MRKVILITGPMLPNPQGGFPAHVLNMNYAAAIAAAGGLPVIMTEGKLAEEYAQLADGLLLTGGESVHPRWFGETFAHMAGEDAELIRQMKGGCAAMRDDLEIAAFRAFYAAQKPIMGICRGHQLLNAMLGGKNILNFPRSKNHPVEHSMGVQHEIIAEKGTLLERLYGERFWVNSYHQDCAVEPGPGVRVAALSPDGIIEAIEHETLPIWGFQFHPERMRGDTPNPVCGPDADALFQYFVERC